MISVGGNATIAGFSGASPAAAGSVALGTVTIVSLPERLMALARPFTITATSAGQRSDTIAVLRTPYGQVLVEADFSLPANRPLSLTIAVGNPPLKGQLALLVTPPKGDANSAATPVPLPMSGGSTATAAGELKPGAIVRAMPVGPGATDTPRAFPTALASLAARAAMPIATPAPTGWSPSISETALRVLQAPLLAQTVADSSSSVARGAVPVSLPAAVQPTHELSLRIVQIIAPPLASADAGAETSVARVVNTTLAGQPIVQLDGDVLVLDTQQRVPKGTLLIVERLIVPPTVEGDAAPAPRAAAAWSPVADALQALTRAEIPAMAALRNQMQAVHAQFSGTTLFLMAALRLGDPKALLGERTAESLSRSGRGELLERLREAARRSSATMTDANQGEWRVQSLPMLDGDAIVPVQLAFRRADEEESEAGARGGAKPQRFLVDIAPSALGPLQIEGLLAGGRLDLVVRSETPVPESLAQELSDRFSRSLREAGLSGALVIHAGTGSFVKLKRTQNEVGLVA
jgi:hypothetical protein